MSTRDATLSMLRRAAEAVERTGQVGSTLLVFATDRGMLVVYPAGMAKGAVCAVLEQLSANGAELCEHEAMRGGPTEEMN